MSIFVAQTLVLFGFITVCVWVQSEVDFLGKFSHPNLVKLLGYCWEENQFLLVYEYMQKGSLESHLFRSMKLINSLVMNQYVLVLIN